jgi:hypothetical protein
MPRKRRRFLCLERGSCLIDTARSEDQKCAAKLTPADSKFLSESSIMSLSFNTTRNINRFFDTYCSADRLVKSQLKTIELANPILDRFVNIFNDTLSSCQLSPRCQEHPNTYKELCEATCSGVRFSVHGNELEIGSVSKSASPCRFRLSVMLRAASKSLHTTFTTNCNSKARNLDFQFDLEEPLSKVKMSGIYTKRKPVLLFDVGLNRIVDSLTYYKDEYEKLNGPASPGSPSPAPNSNQSPQQPSASGQTNTGSLPSWLIGIGVGAGLALLYSAYKSRKSEAQKQKRV